VIWKLTYNVLADNSLLREFLFGFLILLHVQQIILNIQLKMRYICQKTNSRNDKEIFTLIILLITIANYDAFSIVPFRRDDRS